MTRAVGSVVLAVVLVGCGGGPDPQPFRGPAPRSIAILPLTAPDLAPGLRRALDVGVRARLSERGYSIVGPDVVGPALATDRELDADQLVAIRRAFGVDAVLERNARMESGRLGADGRPFSVQWTILSTLDGRVLWSRRESGGPGGLVSSHLVGPRGRYEPDPFFSDEPIVGRGDPDWVTEVRARDPDEQALVVQRALMERLPPASRD